MYMITVENESGDGEFDGCKFSRIAADAVVKLTQKPQARTVPPGTYTLDDEDAEAFCVAGAHGTLCYGDEVIFLAGEAQPEKPTSIRLSTATRRQIQWLTAQGHGNQSKVIALAVHQMFVMEKSGHAPGKE